MNKFEKLIEFVIQDEHEKARELFHDIVVEKSRSIYEDLMDEGEEVDIEADVDADEGGEDYDFSDDEEFSDDGEEESDEESFEIDDEEGEEGDLEDRVVNLEDQLDELMAEFEDLMSGDSEGDDFGDEDDFSADFSDDEDFTVDGGDELAVDDTESFDELSENIDLTPAPKPVTSEESWVNTKSINADNSGAIGAVAKPVKMTGDKAQGRPTPKSGDLPDAGKFKNVPAKDNSKLSPAPKPVTSQASGVNNTTPFPKV